MTDCCRGCYVSLFLFFLIAHLSWNHQAHSFSPARALSDSNIRSFTFPRTQRRANPNFPSIESIIKRYADPSSSIGTSSTELYRKRDYNRPLSMKQKLVQLSLSIMSTLRSNYKKAASLISSKLKSSRRKIGKSADRQPDPDRNGLVNKLIFWLRSLTNDRKMLGRTFVVALMAFLYAKHTHYTKSLTTELSFSAFLSMLSETPERISALQVTASSMYFRLDGTQSALTRIVPIDNFMLDKLVAAGVAFSTPPAPMNLTGLIISLVYIAFLWRISSRMMQGPQDEGVGKSRDKINLKAYANLSFDDVAGQEEAKLEVKELCEMLKDPQRYASIGARIPSGILLCGPPGSGKTLLARVTAAESKVPFYSCSASDFVEVFVGRGPARVRKLFKQAASTAPCIIFIDEIDSIGRSRRMGSMNSEQENTLNQLLTSMDGLDTSNNGVVVMGATNRLELLDPALLRAGRFDRIVQCPLPDRKGRFAILRVHTKNLNLSPDLDLDRIARLTPGTSGADLSTITNEAAIRTARRNGSIIESADFDDALRTYFSGRGVSFGGLAEAAGVVGITNPFKGGNFLTFFNDKINGGQVQQG